MTLDFFYVPSVEYSHKFIDVLQDVYKKLKDRVVFEPSIVSFTSKSSDFIAKNCVSNGNYCSFEPSHEKTITGRDVILEGVRQKCIYKANVDSYFNYMTEFYKTCIHEFTEACSQRILKTTNLKWTNVETCAGRSFHGMSKMVYQNENDLLSDDKEKLKRLSHATFPNIYINGILYKGSLEHFDILLSICSALNDETFECKNLDIVPFYDLSLTDMLTAHLAVLFVGIIVMAFICRRIAKRQYLR